MSNILSRIYDGGAAVTKSDTVNDGPWASLWIGGAGSGNLKVTMLNGDVVAFAGVPVGFFWISVLRVWSTGTDVTGIVGLKAAPYMGKKASV